MNGAASLDQQIGAASQPAHLVCLVHPAVQQEGPSLR